MKPRKASKSGAKAATKKANKPAAGKKAASKAATKTNTSGLRAAAARVKNALVGRTKPSQSPSKQAAARTAPARAAKSPANKAAPVKSISSMQNNKASSIVAPKGLLTEAQLRRMPEREYMNDAQLSFFRHKLLEMRQEVLDREVEVKERLHEREVFADPADRATAEEEHWLDLRLRERESLLLRKIDDALRRIEAREFGYCEKTGDPIGIPRLLARPTATVCVDVKGQDERVEAQFRDR
jgi:DnaK suppressor protein